MTTGRQRLAIMGREDIASPMKFIAVGLVAAAIYLGILHGMVAGLSSSTVTGALAAFFFANLVSYIGNSLWTFSGGVNRATFWKFWVVTGAGFALNGFIAFLFDFFGGHHLVAGLVILIIVPAFNYLCHRHWTYR